MKPYYSDKYCTIYYARWEEVLPELVPGKVDLLLTDPPYGIKAAREARQKTRGKLAKPKNYGDADWDDVRESRLPTDHAVHHIIFGGNYYADMLPPSSCWLVWDKLNTGDFADCELAYTNLPGAVRRYTYRWNGMLKQLPEDRWHPTQKPIAIMHWCIGMADHKTKSHISTIIDPYMGSGTTLRAAKDLQRQAVGIEINERYCEIAAKRLSQEVLPFK